MLQVFCFPFMLEQLLFPAPEPALTSRVTLNQNICRPSHLLLDVELFLFPIFFFFNAAHGYSIFHCVVFVCALDTCLAITTN